MWWVVREQLQCMQYILWLETCSSGAKMGWEGYYYLDSILLSRLLLHSSVVQNTPVTKFIHTANSSLMATPFFWYNSYLPKSDS